MPTRRYLDVLLVLVAAIPVLAAGAPVFGYVLGGGAWIVQRGIQATRHRWLARLSERGTMRRAAMSLFEGFARIWFLAIAIVLADAIGGRGDGLTAALVIFAAYSVAFVLRLLSGPPPEIR